MNDIKELREILFGALRGLNDKEAPLDLDRARATADIAQTIINSARVEVEFIKAAGGKGSGFIPLSGTPAPGADRSPFQNAIANVTGGR